MPPALLGSHAPANHPKHRRKFDQQVLPKAGPPPTPGTFVRQQNGAVLLNTSVGVRELDAPTLQALSYRELAQRSEIAKQKRRLYLASGLLVVSLVVAALM